MHTSPLVSVIIPTYNGKKHLKEALNTVFTQTYAPLEVLVVDNGSTDGTREYLSAIPTIRLFFHEQPSTAATRNLGLTHARGSFIAFLDQDDLWVPEKLAWQVAYLEKQPNAVAVLGKQQMFLHDGAQKPAWLKSAFLEAPLPGFLPSALMARKEAFRTYGLFDESLPLASDVAWFFTLSDHGAELGHLDEVVVRRRIHEKNASNKYQTLHKELLLAMKTSLNMRRQQCTL